MLKPSSGLTRSRLAKLVKRPTFLALIAVSNSLVIVGALSADRNITMPSGGTVNTSE